MTTAHSRHSVLREIIVEHLFIGEALRRLWAQGVHDTEVLRSEFDAGGYDLVIARGGLTRHVQMKALREGGKTRHFTVSEQLSVRPSGCIVAAIVSDDLNFAGWRYFGGAPGHPLPPIDGYPTARHSKGDASGYKARRSGHRKVPLSAFSEPCNLPDLLEKLLGKDIRT